MVLRGFKWPAKLLVKPPQVQQGEILDNDDDASKQNFSPSLKSTMRGAFFLLLTTIFLKVIHGNNFCERRFEKRLDTLKVVNQHLDYLWNLLDQDIQNARKAIIETRMKSNRLDYNYIVINVLGNILRLAGRVIKVIQ